MNVKSETQRIKLVLKALTAAVACGVLAACVGTLPPPCSSPTAPTQIGNPGVSYTIPLPVPSSPIDSAG